MFSKKSNLNKLNKNLIKALDEPSTEFYDKAKAWYDEMITQYGHRHCHEIEEFIDWIPRENEISINIRVSKDLIRDNKKVAKLFSSFYDVYDVINKK